MPDAENSYLSLQGSKSPGFQVTFTGLFDFYIFPDLQICHSNKHLFIQLRIIFTRDFRRGSLREILLSESTENLYRVKIALQLSFIVWVMLVIFMFYATFEATTRMYGTFLLLFMVVIFTPFLPDGTGYEEGKPE